MKRRSQRISWAVASILLWQGRCSITEAFGAQKAGSRQGCIRGIFPECQTAMLERNDDSNKIPHNSNDMVVSQISPNIFKKSDYNEVSTCDREVHRINPSLLLCSTALLLLASVPLVAPAAAIDHPVDFIHLNIPNPLPDADFRYFVSGGVCAAASHGITTPIDVVKTRIQSEPEVFNQGVLKAATTIVKDDGPQTLLSGLLPTVLGYGFEGALKFGLYESLKPSFVQLLSPEDPTVGYFAASVAAGAVASMVLCPMERTRIRLVTDPAFADGFVSGLLRLTQDEGLGAIFFGLPAMLSKQVPYTMAKQVSFDMFAAKLYNYITAQTEVQFCAAFLASILACLASHPGDVILTATYKQGTSSMDGFPSVVANLYDEKGPNGFFAGLTARFFHVGGIITSQLVLYDVIKQLLGLPATGTH